MAKHAIDAQIGVAVLLAAGGARNAVSSEIAWLGV
jgi:hypothetical protein